MNHSISDDGNTMLLRIRGELDALSAPELRPVLDRLIDERQPEVCRGPCRSFDSSTARVSARSSRSTSACERTSGSVRFTGVKAQPLVIFKLLRLDIVFGLAEDGHQAVYGLAPEPLSGGPTGSFQVGR